MSIYNEIKQRCKDATPGPWKMCNNASYGKSSGIIGEPYVTYAVTVVNPVDQQPYIDWKENAEFISHARTDIPLLLKALELACEDLATLENFRKVDCGKPEDYLDEAQKEIDAKK